MNLHKIYSIFFLPFIVGLLTMLVVTGCSDDERSCKANTVMCSLNSIRSTSFEKGKPLVLWANLNQMSSAQKIKVVMTHNGTTVSQTLLLNAYNANNAEYVCVVTNCNYWPVLIRLSAIICMTVLMRYCWQDLPAMTMN